MGVLPTTLNQRSNQNAQSSGRWCARQRAWGSNNSTVLNGGQRVACGVCGRNAVGWVPCWRRHNGTVRERYGVHRQTLEGYGNKTGMWVSNAGRRRCGRAGIWFNGTTNHTYVGKPVEWCVNTGGKLTVCVERSNVQSIRECASEGVIASWENHRTGQSNEKRTKRIQVCEINTGYVL